MWIKAVGAERVAELFHNYENALGICRKGSESGSWNEAAQPQKSAMNATSNSGLESTKSHEYFSQQGAAESGCKAHLYRRSGKKSRKPHRASRSLDPR
jgi:hypothetical protein